MTWERPSGGAVAPSPGGDTWEDLARAQYGNAVPFGQNSIMAGEGSESFGIDELDSTSVFGQDDNGIYLQQNSAAAAGSDALCRGLNPVYSTQNNPNVPFKFEVPDWTSQRFFAGLTSSLIMIASDDPAGHYVGVHWVPGRGGGGDTEFKAVSKDGVTQRLTNFTPSVVPQDGKHYFGGAEVSGNGTSIRVWIEDEAGTVLGEATLTLNLPSPTQALRSQSGLEATAASVRTCKNYGWNSQTKGQT